MTTDMELYEPAPPPATLFGSDDPSEVVARASAAARPLADIINKQHLYATIGGKKHVLVEGYTLLGSMLGVFPVLDGDPVEVEVDGARGWRATVRAVTRDGSVVGRASALCLRSEKTWRSRDEYALMSMAQTRATSKALRQPLGFVMTLAGYSATPAEEMPRDEVEVTVTTGATPAYAAMEEEASFSPTGEAFPDERPDGASQFVPPAGAAEGSRGSITDGQNRMIRRLVSKLAAKPFEVPEETLLTQLQLQYEKNDWMELEKGEAIQVISDLKKQADEA